MEHLPRTGIEYPFTKERRQINFNSHHKEFEPLSDQVISTFQLDEYIRNDLERANASQGLYPVVYDCIEPSPYYAEDESLHPYIDEKDAIELPPITDQTEGLVNEPYQKRYIFNPLSLPYQLERACFPGSSSTLEGKGYEKRSGAPKLNRYYDKLKPFYHLEKSPEGDKTLIFESRFESGNLKRAVKV